MRLGRHRLTALVGALGGCGTAPTYQDVAPVLAEHCIPCHREGGMGPVSFETYDETRAEAPRIAEEVGARRMPPLPADPACRPIDDPRVLGENDRALLLRWAREGAEEGPAVAPLSPPADGLGPPSDEFDSGLDWTPVAETEYRCFVVDPGFADMVEAIAFDVRSTNPRIVHHSRAYAAVPEASADVARLDEGDPLPGWECLGGPGYAAALPLGHGVVGGLNRPFPEGTGVRLPAGTRFVVQVHYDTTEDRTGSSRFFVEMWRATAPLRGAPTYGYVGTDDIDLPAGQVSEVRAEVAVVGGDVTPEPITEMRQGRAFLVGGHMHQLGESIRLDLVHGGAHECLLDVPQWDFHWQGGYWLEDPVEIRAGDTLEVSCRWDNTTEADVSWGLETRDEMCFAWMLMVD